MQYHDPEGAQGATEGARDGRLFSPVFDRNAPPIIAALVPWLQERTGRVLEIGSGSGQHIGALELAFPHLDWQPSDPAPEHRASIAAWRAHLRLPDRPALDIDGAADWGADVGDLAVVISMNVIHIAPDAVLAGILAGAAKALSPGGIVMFYGPFKEGGVHTGAGNAAFDARLREENAAWGIRDAGVIQRQGEALGLAPADFQVMPANNRLLILRRD